MRIATCVAAAAALLAGAPVALAHEGSPNFLSQINEVTPAAAGVEVEVLNRDDRLLLRNNGNGTVLIEGYDGEPYARIEPDGTVSVNTDSKAYYINAERDGEVAVPPGIDGRPGEIAGTLFWTPLPSSGPPLPLIIAFAALVIPLAVAVVIVRRRRAAAPAAEAW
jgi:hypothetical protein